MKSHVLLLIVILFIVSCSGAQDASDSGPDASIDSGDDTGDIQNPTPPQWLYYSNEGDPQGDCAAEDPQCNADLLNLGFFVEEGMINFQVSFHAPYAGGSFEVFMIPQDVAIPGYSLQYNKRAFHLWKADCTSLLKHSGCHWSEVTLISSLQTHWSDEVTFTLSYSLDDLGFATLTDLLVGVAAAPFDIDVTAEFTDRYPDGLLVVSTGIRNLQRIPLNR